MSMLVLICVIANLRLRFVLFYN